MFNLPAIPTDSLYKFLFVGGLILIIAAFAFSDRQYKSLSDDKVHQKIDSLEYAVNQVSDDHNIKTKFISSTLSHISGKTTKGYDVGMLPRIYLFYRDSLQKSPAFLKRFGLLAQFQATDEPTTIFLNAHIKEVRALLKDLAAYEDNNYAPQITDLRNKEAPYRESNQELINNLKIYKIYTHTAGSLGVLFAVVGVMMWYFKMQKPQDENQLMQIAQLRENLEIQKHNAKIDLDIKKEQLIQLKKANDTPTP